MQIFYTFCHRYYSIYNIYATCVNAYNSTQLRRRVRHGDVHSLLVGLGDESFSRFARDREPIVL